MSGLTYLLSGGASGVVRADLDPSSKGFYQEHVLVRTFKDVFGAPEEASGLILRQAETFYSSNSSAWPLFFNQSLSVITSYSIHYTKLYDPDHDPGAPEGQGI